MNLFSHIRNSLLVSAATLAALATFAGRSAGQSAQPSSTIVVNVGTFRNAKGILGCRLFRSEAGFPETSAGTVEKRTTVSGASTICTFENVPPGTYAVSVMHDENDNRKLDKNFLGIPVEGYGASNNHTHAMSAPTWAESKFTVEAGKNVGLAIALRY